MTDNVYSFDIIVMSEKGIDVKNLTTLGKFLITRRINNIIYRFEGNLEENLPVQIIVNNDLSKLFDIPEDEYMVTFYFDDKNNFTGIKFKSLSNESFLDKIKSFFI